MNNNCPKCGGLTYQSHAYGRPTSQCAMCGLFQEQGGSTESLRKQIQGSLFINERRGGEE